MYPFCSAMASINWDSVRVTEGSLGFYKDGKTSKTFEALTWLAQLTTHIPNKGEQMVRYYGFYSNKSRGLRKKAGTDDEVPALIDSDISRKAFRKNWARLIQKVYNVLVSRGFKQ